MNQVATDLYPILLPTILSAISLYIGFINKMRSQIAVLETKVGDLESECEKATAKMTEMTHTIGILEEKVKRQEMRQDSQSKKNDEVIKLINDFKLEITRQIGDVNKNIIKIQGEVEVINKTIAIFDGGVVSKKE
jgi:chromosome segregation ATPase